MPTLTPPELTTATSIASADLLVVWPAAGSGGPLKQVQYNVLESQLATALGATYLQVANNLSDLTNASTARGNLGLGTAATQNTGTSGAAIPLLNVANTWSAGQVITAGAPGTTSYGLSVTSNVTVKSTTVGAGWSVLDADGIAGNSGFLGAYNSSGTRIGFSAFYNGTTYIVAATDGATDMLFQTDGATRLTISGSTGVVTAANGFAGNLSGTASAATTAATATALASGNQTVNGNLIVTGSIEAVGDPNFVLKTISNEYIMQMGSGGINYDTVNNRLNIVANGGTIGYFDATGYHQVV